MKRTLVAAVVLAALGISCLAAGSAPKIALEFGGSDPVAKIAGAMKGSKLEDGCLVGTIWGSDPSFGFDFTKLKVDTADIPTFSIRMKVDASDGKAFEKLKIYFSTSDSRNLSEDQTVMIDNIVCDNDWHEYTADMSANSHWTGQLQNMRCDFEWISDSTYKGTLVYFDWLHLDF